MFRKISGYQHFVVSFGLELDIPDKGIGTQHLLGFLRQQHILTGKNTRSYAGRDDAQLFGAKGVVEQLNTIPQLTCTIIINSWCRLVQRTSVV